MYRLYCDRCSKPIQSIDEENSLIIKLIKMDDNNLLNMSDLCPNCKNKLNKFLKGAELNNDL